MLAFGAIAAIAACGDPAPSELGNEHKAILEGADNPSVAYVPDALDNEMAAVAAEGEASTKQALKASAEGKFACLSPWDGSSRDLVARVKESLRDPDSFQHIATKIGDNTSAGRRPIIMEYRAKNGFGGYEVAQQPAALDTSTCKVTLIASAREMKRLLGD